MLPFSQESVLEFCIKRIIRNISDKKQVLSLYIYLGRYILIHLDRYMFHTRLDFILDLRNIQIISNRKTQVNYTII